MFQELIRNNLDILIITETWINDSEEYRETGKRAGLAMLCRKNFEVTNLVTGQSRTFEHIKWNIQVNKKSLPISSIYHLPPKDRVTNSMVIDDFMDHLAPILPTAQRNSILGDLNIHVDNVQDNDNNYGTWLGPMCQLLHAHPWQ